METEIKRDSSGKFVKGAPSPNPSGRSKASKRISELAKAYTSDALEALSEIVNSRTSSDSARVQAANSLLDRAYGRPIQQNENVNVGVNYLDYLDMLAKETTEVEIKSVEVSYSVDDL
ncbi:MAG: hypothetical protein GY777_05940 [Candidatus Brocadiaceae bacterium]|nr:hypothetical protein [Candidatus Brocadiaceae bacterium]